MCGEISFFFSKVLNSPQSTLFELNRELFELVSFSVPCKYEPQSVANEMLWMIEHQQIWLSMPNSLSNGEIHTISSSSYNRTHPRRYSQIIGYSTEKLRVFVLWGREGGKKHLEKVVSEAACQNLRALGDLLRKRCTKNLKMITKLDTIKQYRFWFGHYMSEFVCYLLASEKYGSNFYFLNRKECFTTIFFHNFQSKSPMYGWNDGIYRI